jgi:3-hydroxyisobutyrate dehydrogenase
MDRLTKVGFIGLGNMGQPMAALLLKAGFDLTVLDANAGVQQAFVAQCGGTAASSLRELGSTADAVITMLPDGHVVRRVVLGGEGDGDDRLLGSMRKGTILIDMSSSSPTGTQALGKVLAQQGISMLDAPVSGGVSRAQKGTLAIMVGGETAAVERCRPLFEAMGERVFETGVLGSGHAIKALNNLVSAAGLIAAAEALLIGHRFGLDPTVMIDVLNASTGRNNSTENKFKQFILSRAFNSGFSLDLMVKDLTTAVDLARETGTPTVFSAACRELWAAALSRLENGSDHTAVVRWFEELAEVELGGV